MPRKKDTITLSVPPGTKEKLEAIAEQNQIYWGKKPSVSGLLGAIAQGELSVGQPFQLNRVQIESLRQALKNLIDAGHPDHAQVLMSLLLERGALEMPLKQELLRTIDQTTESVRVRLNQLIEHQQPFLLTYQNSQDETLVFTVRFAQIKLYEKRLYLQTWCKEIIDSEDIPELQHHRCFRLDRMQNKYLLPIEEPWREGFDEVEVQLHLYGWLKKAYEPKPDDIADEIRDDYRWVKRRVINTFWFFRSIAPYYADCEIIAPASVRQRHQEHIAKLSQLYGDRP
ncbi:MAG: WYL domain-containing protein [Spirulina sp. SIO3F2]|nr:WYL domain-containing protein [Spirulina sp. SIO3F2]